MRLHIGGKQVHPEWKIFDIEPRPEVDFLGDAADLSQFENNSIECIYASHVLEHFHHNLNDSLLMTLAEWYRVLKPDGQLLVSVPDLSVLCRLYSEPNITGDERMYLMHVIFGGQLNEYDVHYAGLDFELMTYYLREVGFREWHQIEKFDLFEDCSSLQFKGTYISLNLVIIK